MYEELLKSLRICGAPVSCEGCPHYADKDPNCFIRLKIEAADAIEELQADNTALNGTVTNLLEQIKDLYEHPSKMDESGDEG